MESAQKQLEQIHIVVVNEHTYQMGDKQFKSVLKIAKQKYRQEHKTALYAITKGNVTIMLKEEYPDVDSLRKAISKYKSQGFHTVHYYLAV